MRSRLKKQAFFLLHQPREEQRYIHQHKCCRIAYPELPRSQLTILLTLHPYHPLPWLLNDTLASSFAVYYAALSNRSSSVEGRLVGAKARANSNPALAHLRWQLYCPKLTLGTHLSNSDRSPCQGGDTGKRTAVPTLWMSNHTAVSALQRDFSKFYSLSAWNTRFWLDNLMIQSIQMGRN